MKTKAWDPVDNLNSPEAIENYIRATLEDIRDRSREEWDLLSEAIISDVGLAVRRLQNVETEDVVEDITEAEVITCERGDFSSMAYRVLMDLTEDELGHTFIEQSDIDLAQLCLTVVEATSVKPLAESILIKFVKAEDE
jgi:hypothetical protein